MLRLNNPQQLFVEEFFSQQKVVEEKLLSTKIVEQLLSLNNSLLRKNFSQQKLLSNCWASTTFCWGKISLNNFLLSLFPGPKLNCWSTKLLRPFSEDTIVDFLNCWINQFYIHFCWHLNCWINQFYIHFCWHLNCWIYNSLHLNVFQSKSNSNITVVVKK